MVREKRFREDLYYRLNVFECLVPPLRERREDIWPLASRLLRTASEKYAPGALPLLTPSVLQTLLNYGWPGNVRELRNVMERVALLAAGREVALNNLPSALLSTAETVAAFPEEDRLLTLRELEKRQIRQVLNLGVSMDRAAELLGITSVTLGRKRKELCLRWNCAEVKSIAVAAG